MLVPINTASAGFEFVYELKFFPSEISSEISEISNCDLSLVFDVCPQLFLLVVEASPSGVDAVFFTGRLPQVTWITGILLSLFS